MQRTRLSWVTEVPARSASAQRLYTRDQVEQLRSILRRMEEGSSAADAHRLLAEEIESPTDPAGPERDVLMLVLVAERDRYAAELCEFFLRTEGYDVRLTSKCADAESLFATRPPSLTVLELTMSVGLVGPGDHLVPDLLNRESGPLGDFPGGRHFSPTADRLFDDDFLILLVA